MKSENQLSWTREAGPGSLLSLCSTINQPQTQQVRNRTTQPALGGCRYTLIAADIFALKFSISFCSYGLSFSTLRKCANIIHYEAIHFITSYTMFSMLTTSLLQVRVSLSHKVVLFFYYPLYI